MTWLPQTAAAATPYERVFGLCPDLQADVTAFADLLWTRSVDPVLLELCRLRIAQILGCEPELRRRSAPAVAAGLTEEKVAALHDWPRRAVFSPLERAGLRIAEQFALDPHGVSDADAAALVAHLAPSGMVVFVEALAIFDGFTRFRAILGIAGPE